MGDLRCQKLGVATCSLQSPVKFKYYSVDAAVLRALFRFVI